MASTDDAQQTQARKQSNLAFAFKIAGLDAPRRRAMEVFYTFCRVADDIVDEPKSDAEKIAALDLWRASIHGYFGTAGGTPPHDALAGELAEIVKIYAIPEAPLLAIIDGCAMDIGAGKRECIYETAGDLHTYCYGVASAVGLVSIRIFGCRNPLSEEFAIALGYALQFTNILRDIVEDYHELGRIYLPREELAAFGIAAGDLADPTKNPACKKLFRLQYFRAKHYFNKARRLIAPEDRDALKAAFVMGAFYETLLEKIKAGGFQITAKRIKLSKFQKLRLLRRTLSDLKKPLPETKRPKKIAVIGGGIAGISAAIAATEAGHIAEIFEAKSALGGRASSFTHADTGGEIDNGQHAMFGCYTAFLRLADTLALDDKLAHAEKLDVPYRSGNGRASRLLAGTAAPFHLLKALFNFSELKFFDCLAIIRFGVALRLGSRPGLGETAGTWLARLGQTAGAIRALWEPFCVAALNVSLPEADAGLLHETVRRTLFGNVKDSAIILARVGLSSLFMPEAEVFLKSVGGKIRLRAQVKSLRFENDRVAGITLAGSDEENFSPETVILATPWKSTAALLPGNSAISVSGKQIQGDSILNVHLFTDKKITGEKLIGLLDSPLQWIFKKSETHYAVTISCPGDWIKLPADEIVARTKTELGKLFPESAGFEIKDSFVCKCLDATFSARPATAALRPAAGTPWKNLFLAGDWTATGLPATIEGAAQSGQTAATTLG